jgi:glycosidase
LNPIFESPSTHRYNTTDYFRIDRKLGTMEDWRALVEAAHGRGIRLILDGVFNHCGRGFFAFNDVLENGEHSAYRNWFHIRRFPVDAYSHGDARDYIGWWRLKSLPKFNTDNAEVRQFLLDVGRYWIEQGADGWRLDVPNEIDDDDFWAEFRQVVRAANPEAYLLGEIWDVVPRWVGENHFDGLMNYPLRTAVLELLSGHIKASAFADQVEQLLTVYPTEHLFAQLNSLGTHDTERILTKLDGNVSKVKLAFTFLFAYPGAPSIYYGDEVGLEGHKDPDCRRCFPWDTALWQQDLYDLLKRLSQLRTQHPSLRRGNLARVKVSDSRHCYAFLRSVEDDQILVALNASDAKRTLTLQVQGVGWQNGQECIDLVGNTEYIVSDDELEITLEPYQGLWLATK